MCLYGEKVEVPEDRGSIFTNSLPGGRMDIFWNYMLTVYYMDNIKNKNKIIHDLKYHNRTCRMTI